MSVNVLINIKGASKKIIPIEYEYGFDPGGIITVEQFLDETVRITMERYMGSVTDKDGKETSDQDLLKDKSDRLVKLLKVLSNEEIEEQAQSGKVSFGVHYNEGTISLEKAKDNARQCFIDGLVALFADGERYEKLEDKFSLNEGSNITFVKMVFLAGRMW